MAGFETLCSTLQPFHLRKANAGVNLVTSRPDGDELPAGRQSRQLVAVRDPDRVLVSLEREASLGLDIALDPYELVAREVARVLGPLSDLLGGSALEVA